MKKQQPAELGGSEETKPAKPTVTPARRMENVEEYYFSVKLKEVARMNESGTRVINLGIGSPDLPPSAETVQALCQAAARPDTHGYQPYVGIPELRAEFARWYKRWYGVDLDPANEILPPDRQQGGCDAHFAGLPERRRRGTHTQSGLSDLRLGVEAHRRPHPALRPEKKRTTGSPISKRWRKWTCPV